MPYGTLKSWDEQLGDAAEMDFILTPEDSGVEDTKEGVGVGDLVVLQHHFRDEDGTRWTLHGSLIVEGGKEGKDKLLALYREKKRIAITVRRESRAESFPTIRVKATEGEATVDEGSEGGNNQGTDSGANA